MTEFQSGIMRNIFIGSIARKITLIIISTKSYVTYQLEAIKLLNMTLSALGYGEKYLVAYSDRSNDQKIIYLLVGL